MPIPEPSTSAPAAERELVQACKKGQLSAYEQLYASHGGRMKSIALNLLGNPSDAEDAVQETFLKMHRSVETFRGQSSLTTWVYRILVNTCYDMRRSRRRLQDTPSLDDEISFAASMPAFSSNHPLRLALEKSVARLEDQERTVFLLFEVEGFKHSEIAKILDIAEGTSKSVLFDAKRRLRKWLQEAPQSMRME